jgi:hypothetical protein
MELKDFIKTTLLELAQGINEAGKELDGQKIAVTNTTLRAQGHGDYGFIDFDLAVEVKNSKKASGGGGFKVAIAEATIGKSGETTSSSTSRIKFTLEASFNSQRLFKS